MKLTNRIFNIQTSNEIERLAKLPVSNFKIMKTFFSIVKLKIEYFDTKRAFDIAEASMGVDYCDKDEKGKPILGPNNRLIFNEKRKEFNQKYAELLEQEVELDLDPIKIKASEEPILFNREVVCSKCKEKCKKEDEWVITADVVAALSGIIEFSE